jgi:hypothetical protein
MECYAKILRLPARSTILPLKHRIALIRMRGDHRWPFGSESAPKSRDEAIAPAFSDQDFSMRGVALNFLTEAIDVGFEGVG